MDVISQLWAYQMADMQADRFEKEQQRSPKRQQLIKTRDFLLQQQEVMHRIEAEVEAMGERVEVLIKDVVSTEADLSDLQETLREEEPETLEIVRKSLSHAQKLVMQISRLEQELSRIRKDADNRDKQQHEVRVRAAKARAEFDQLKQVYDGEHKEAMVQLSALKNAAQKAAEGLDIALLEKYKQIKQHAAPAVAKLVDSNRCSGCNMNLPQVVLRSIRMGEKMVDCENCGRIVLVEE